MLPIKQKGFTLIELLVVIAVVGVLASVVMFLVDPAGQMAKGRDAKRKTDIKTIANALEQYFVFNQQYPYDSMCDSSLGYDEVNVCPVSGSDWNSSSGLAKALTDGGYVKKMPKDPKNNSTYFYEYEPDAETQGSCWINDGSNFRCKKFTFGAKLEKPKDTSASYFNCNEKGECGEFAAGP